MNKAKKKNLTLGDIVSFKRGYDLPHRDREPGNYPIISSSGQTGWHKYPMAIGPGVVTGRYGTLGEVFYIPSDYWPLNTSLYVENFKGNNPRFVYYYLKTVLNENFNSAGAVPGVNRNYLHKIRVPPLPKSREKVAAILTAYEELIENNNRRIALLEKMAEEIYREWFVRFRFPGYKKEKFVKGIPKDWQLIKLEKAFQFTGGGTPSKERNAYWKEGSVNWFTPSDITTAKGMYLTESKDKPNEEGISNCSAKMFPAYSIMMTSRATIGEIGINRTPACTNQGFITCIPNSTYSLPYLYFWLKLSRSHFISLCGGATFPELNKGTFKRIEILTPAEEIMAQYKKLVDPIFDQIESLLIQNENLTKTKDMLLPRLISGKLSVEDLDIQFPPGMRETGAA
ncbi:restriction endonuclease subunit S [Microbulbifer litoralis]|uniref:restriction endonuclease subunit S n=1 Tax=Microbulbifer litoralis TaxID=2933965 RepID=UPI0020294519|nr:restriction endonuclease subunit S [Microbulbifer sp. GX H0434]